MERYVFIDNPFAGASYSLCRGCKKCKTGLIYKDISPIVGINVNVDGYIHVPFVTPAIVSIKNSD